MLASDLPAGGRDLNTQCRVNGEVVQDANTSDMIFDIAEAIEIFTECMTLEPSEVLVMWSCFGKMESTHMGMDESSSTFQAFIGSPPVDGT